MARWSPTIQCAWGPRPNLSQRFADCSRLHLTCRGKTATLPFTAFLDGCHGGKPGSYSSAPVSPRIARICSKYHCLWCAPSMRSASCTRSLTLSRTSQLQSSIGRHITHCSGDWAAGFATVVMHRPAAGAAFPDASQRPEICFHFPTTKRARNKDAALSVWSGKTGTMFVLPAFLLAHLYLLPPLRLLCVLNALPVIINQAVVVQEVYVV